MSLLVALLKDCDFDGAIKLMTTSPENILLEVSQSKSTNEEVEDPSIFYALENLEVVEQMLLLRPECSWSRNRCGDRPLHRALQFPNVDLEVVRLLLFSFPEGASTRNLDGKMPLHYAAANISDLKILELVVSSFPQALDVGENKNDSKPLHYACAFKMPLGVVEFLLNAGDAVPKGTPKVKSREVVKDKDRQGNLPLHLALMYDSEIAVSELLLREYPEAAAVPDAKGRLSLQLAAASTIVTHKFMERLIAAFPGAVHKAYRDVHAEQAGGGPRGSTSWFNGKKPIHVALKSHAKPAVIRALLMNALSPTFILRMAREKKEHKSKFELKREKQMEKEKEKERKVGEGEGEGEGEEEGKGEGKKFAGNDDDEDDEVENTPVFTAVEDEGQSLNQVGEDGALFGDTLLHTALEFDASEEVLETLLSVLPMLIHERNADGKLPMHYAAWRQSPCSVLKLLIKYHAEALNMADEKNGNLPLHYAIQYGPRGKNADVRVALYLLSHCPAAVFTPNGAGYYPIHLAARAACPSVLIEALLRVCPYSYGFTSKNYLKLLPIDFALFFEAPPAAVSALLGIPKRLTTSPDPALALKATSSPPLAWKEIDGKAEDGPEQLPVDAGLEHPPADEVPVEEEHPLRAVGGLKTALLNLQEKYLQQGEEMRKMRIRMHNQAKAINKNTDEITGLKRDINWGKDRIKILEREVKALNNELDSLR